ncbi:hypothetical protein CCACVL1_00066 [Corchorus capsularis]|uniref:Uncharacterized protein n=1 Tax=Corchorus capsularis TaxID=210143 RepID=A0A1R3KYT6_COCAP|nr:hypothetical protein CCACVL1_00066 [Corchorus capsularis]
MGKQSEFNIQFSHQAKITYFDLEKIQAKLSK